MADQNQNHRATEQSRLPASPKKTGNAYSEPFSNQRTAFDPSAAPPADRDAGAPIKEPVAKTTPEPNPVAEEPAHRREPAAAKPKAAPKKQSSSKKGTAKAKNASEKEQIYSSTATATPSAKKDKPQKVLMNLPRSTKPAHQVIPFVLVGLSIFIGISLILNIFCNPYNSLTDPYSHWMGIVGYYICYALFGTFGPAAFVLPLLLLNLAVFWKRYIDHKLTISKIVVTLIFLIMLSTVIHIFCLMALPAGEEKLSASDLFLYGTQMTGGGFLGGTLGYLLVQLCSYAGSLILSFLLLGASLFYFLGMTPQHLWEYLRNRRALRAGRTPSLSEQSAEEAENRVKMEEKIRRTVGGQISVDAPETGAPAGAVRVVSQTAPKKTAADKMAPMPMPHLDPNDGEEVFVPAAVDRKMNSGEGTPATTPSAPAAPTPEAPQSQPSADVAANRDAAVEPIFPKANDPSRAPRKSVRTDRNFDLKNIFIDLEERPATPTRQHAPVPPEVPPTLSRTPAQTPVKREPAAGTSASKSTAPRPAAAPPRPAAPGAQRPTGAPSATGTRPTTAAGQKPLPTLPTVPKAKGPTFHRAEDVKQDFGLSNEEFERLEAENQSLPRPGAAAKTAAKPASAPGKPAKASTKEKAPTPKVARAKPYVFPPLSYLHPGEPMTPENLADIQQNLEGLANTLSSFRVGVNSIDYACGPTVTRYEVTPAAGVRVRSIVNLSDDIALALRSPGGVRIEAPIPGKNAVGVEIPNHHRSTVYLREILESPDFKEASNKLTVALGASVAGKPLVMDIAKMPHLLVAGTTGSGKSVCINCIIMSLLYRTKPDEVKLVLIDPKKVEFSIYKNIPHLMAPIVTMPKDAAGALQAAVEEMENRFERFEQVGVHDLKGYNSITANDPEMPFLPQIVIIIDELADLMMTAPGEVETAICRIAQKARAAGMHLIVGTQRPSVDVVTGLIKSNIPSRIAFTVSSQVDSRTILDNVGAEKLSGRGDMLFAPIGALKPSRVQGAFVDEKEVEKICEFIRATNGTAEYDERFISKLKALAAQCGTKGKGGGELPSGGGEDGDKGSDAKYAEAVRVVIEEKRASTSLLQRRLEIGYSRAAKILDRMQAEGLISPPDGAKPRTILITAEQYMERFVDGAGASGDSDE